MKLLPALHAVPACTGVNWGHRRQGCCVQWLLCRDMPASLRPTELSVDLNPSLAGPPCASQRSSCACLCIAVSCSCPALPCPALPCPHTPCPALSCPQLLRSHAQQLREGAMGPVGADEALQPDLTPDDFAWLARHMVTVLSGRVLSWALAGSCHAGTATAPPGSSGTCRSRWTPTTTRCPTLATTSRWRTRPRCGGCPRCPGGVTTWTMGWTRCSFPACPAGPAWALAGPTSTQGVRGVPTLPPWGDDLDDWLDALQLPSMPSTPSRPLALCPQGCTEAHATVERQTGTWAGRTVDAAGAAVPVHHRAAGLAWPDNLLSEGRCPICRGSRRRLLAPVTPMGLGDHGHGPARLPAHSPQRRLCVSDAFVLLSWASCLHCGTRLHQLTSVGSVMSSMLSRTFFKCAAPADEVDRMNDSANAWNLSRTEPARS